MADLWVDEMVVLSVGMSGIQQADRWAVCWVDKMADGMVGRMVDQLVDMMVVLWAGMLVLQLADQLVVLWVDETAEELAGM